MKKGFSLPEVLLGLILSFFILTLSLEYLKLAKVDYNQYFKQDLISSLQIHQILNGASNIEVFDQEIRFKYLNQERVLCKVNNKLIIKPGVMIYYFNIHNHHFIVKEDKIYLKIERANYNNTYLIGIYE